MVGPCQNEKWTNSGKIVDAAQVVKLLARYHAKEEQITKIDTFLREHCNATEGHGNGQAVLIWGRIDEDKYAIRIREHGAKAIAERVFPSASAASRHLGYLWDSVGQALRRAALRGEDAAVVAGVPFRWADSIGGLN